MRWLIESVMVFFGTLMAAAVVALGAPAVADLAIVEAVTQTLSSPAPSNEASDLLQILLSVTDSVLGPR
jgi:hypothetical protein